jgi:dihydroxyacetone kinase-like protein
VDADAELHLVHADVERRRARGRRRARRQGDTEAPAAVVHALCDRRDLGERGIEIARSLVGSYVTSLDMAGASITLLTLDDELIGWWDAPVQTPALRWGR